MEKRETEYYYYYNNERWKKLGDYYRVRYDLTRKGKKAKLYIPEFWRRKQMSEETKQEETRSKEQIAEHKLSAIIRLEGLAIAMEDGAISIRSPSYFGVIFPTAEIDVIHATLAKDFERSKAKVIAKLRKEVAEILGLKEVKKGKK